MAKRHLFRHPGRNSRFCHLGQTSGIRRVVARHLQRQMADDRPLCRDPRSAPHRLVPSQDLQSCTGHCGSDDLGILLSPRASHCFFRRDHWLNRPNNHYQRRDRKVVCIYLGFNQTNHAAFVCRGAGGRTAAGTARLRRAHSLSLGEWSGWRQFFWGQHIRFSIGRLYVLRDTYRGPHSAGASGITAWAKGRRWPCSLPVLP